jgi:hypothetical protein
MHKPSYLRKNYIPLSESQLNVQSLYDAIDYIIEQVIGSYHNYMMLMFSILIISCILLITFDNIDNIRLSILDTSAKVKGYIWRKGVEYKYINNKIKAKMSPYISPYPCYNIIPMLTMPSKQINTFNPNDCIKSNKDSNGKDYSINIL